MKTLKVLRKRLKKMQTRAAEMLTEMTDDLPEDAARAMETDHVDLVRDIADVEADIAELEAEVDADGERGDDEPITSAPQPNTTAATIFDIGRRAEMPDADIETALSSNVSIDDFRTLAFEHLATRSAGSLTQSTMIIRDEGETRRDAMTEALSYRLGVQPGTEGPTDAARQFMEYGVIDIASEVTQTRGAVRSVRQIEDVLSRASQSTSDFPAIFEGAINRSLEARYALAVPTYRAISRRRDFRDFRPHTTVKLGDFPLLQKVLETGQIKHGSFTDGKETISCMSYAIQMRISRQMMVNDDLGAIGDMLTSYGESVALFEELTFYSEAFNGKLADGKTVYHSDHKNLAAGAAGINVDSVTLARAAMSKQKSQDNNPLLSNKARILLCGPDKITQAEMLVASLTPATAADVNVFSGKLDPQETAMIDGNAWYAFADPGRGSNYRWGYLDGYAAPRVRTEEPFGTQGMAMSVEHDFGVGATDFRFGYKNAGA